MYASSVNFLKCALILVQKPSPALQAPGHCLQLYLRDLGLSNKYTLGHCGLSAASRHKLASTSRYYLPLNRGAGAGPAGTAAAGPMLEAKLMNLIKGWLQKFWLSNNFSHVVTRPRPRRTSHDMLPIPLLNTHSYMTQQHSTKLLFSFFFSSITTPQVEWKRWLECTSQVQIIGCRSKAILSCT